MSPIRLCILIEASIAVAALAAFAATSDTLLAIIFLGNAAATVGLTAYDALHVGRRR